MKYEHIEPPAGGQPITAHTDHSLLEESAEIDSDIAAHTALPDAHTDHRQ